MADQRFTVTEAADLVGCSRSKLYELVANREVPYRRLGGRGRYYFLQPDIDKIISDSLVRSKSS